MKYLLLVLAVVSVALGAVPDKYILDVSTDCSTNHPTSAGVVIISDLPAVTVVIYCSDDTTVDVNADATGVNYEGIIYYSSSNGCAFKAVSGVATYTAMVRVAWGQEGSLILSQEERYQITCSFDDKGDATTGTKTVGPALVAPQEIQRNEGVATDAVLDLYIRNILGGKIVSSDIPMGKMVQLYGSAIPAPTLKDDVRLVDGSAPGEGRLEVKYEGTWGTVCDDGFGIEDATVACRMLGYKTDVAPQFTTAFADGTGDIKMYRLGCVGTEASLFACTYQVPTVCGHNEDIGVKCLAEYIGGDPGSLGLNVVSCAAIGSDNGMVYNIIRGGCGDGVIFPTTEGFITKGLEVTSSFIPFFGLKGNSAVGFKCNFTICTSGCDGTSCVSARRKRSEAIADPDMWNSLQSGKMASLIADGQEKNSQHVIAKVSPRLLILQEDPVDTDNQCCSLSENIWLFQALLCMIGLFAIAATVFVCMKRRKVTLAKVAENPSHHYT